MKLPHWIGFRLIPHEQGVRLVGRNAAVPFLFGFLVILVVVLPILMVAPEQIFQTTDPGAVAAVLIFMLLGGGGAFYMGTCIPMKRNIIFSCDRVEMIDEYLFGRKEIRISYSSLSEIRFSVTWNRKALFRITHIDLRNRDDSRVSLIHRDCPMYSWQGQKAFDAVRDVLHKSGRSHLLAPKPNFLAAE